MRCNPRDRSRRVDAVSCRTRRAVLTALEMRDAGREQARRARGADGDLARARRHARELFDATSSQPMLQGYHQQGLVLSARIDLAEHRPAGALDASRRPKLPAGGRTLVETQAAAIADGWLRDSFLRRVDANRALLTWDLAG